MLKKSKYFQFKTFTTFCLFVLIVHFIDESTTSDDYTVRSTSRRVAASVQKRSNILPKKKLNNFQDFPNSLLGFVSSENTAKLDPCQDKNNNSPKRCLSLFENVAFGRKVLTSITCTSSKSTKCDLSKTNSVPSPYVDRISLEGHSTIRANSEEEKHNRRSISKEIIPRGSCDEVGICDSPEHRQSYSSTSQLTDLNNPSTATCWTSDYLPSHPTTHHKSSSTSQMKNTSSTSHKINSLGTSYDPQTKYSLALKPERNKTHLKTKLRFKNKLSPISRPNTTLTLNFGKKYEITYVSLQFCTNTIPSDIPLAIYKSSDYGKTWNPYQLYANNCKQFFGIPSKLYASASNEQEVLCSDIQHARISESTEIIGFHEVETFENSLKSLDRNIGERGQHFDESLSLNESPSVVQSTISQNVSLNLSAAVRTSTTPHFSKSSSVTSESMPATSRNKRTPPKIAVAKSFLSKHRVVGSNWARASAKIGENRVAFNTLEGRPSAYNIDKSPVLQDWMTVTDIQLVFFSPLSSNSSSSKSVPRFVSLADLSIGGRCKCNGHAHRCIEDNQGKTTCDCKHNTAGIDCEKCKPFYYDRPWGRATLDDPHPCIACHCNGHTRQCRFSLELYKMSGQRSGSVCIRCRHQTSGRNCHYCKEGYYRDYSKSISSKKACKRCSCHLIGSFDSTCNHATGQCRCKEGVTGLSCNSCAKGYQQSRSPLSPCSRFLPANESSTKQITSPLNSVTSACGRCPKEGSLKRKLFCASEYVLQAKVRTIEQMDSWTTIRIFIHHSYKHPEGKIKQKSDLVWISTKNLKCNCPYKIEEGRTYLFVGSPGELMTDMENSLQLDKKSFVTPWNKRLVLKVTQLVRDQQRGRCSFN